MALIHLDISRFRNLLAVQLAPISQGFNFIYGNNGSGKTSLLESIYYLSLGRSFRSTIIQRVVHQSSQKLSIFAHIATGIDQFIPVGLERHAQGELKLRVSGEDVRSISEIANLLPVQLIDAHCHNLLEGGPVYRRKYLDWGLFYFAPGFLHLWRQYERALKQRNAALRGHLPRKELDAWTHELITHALELDQLRRQYVEHLLPILESTLTELLICEDLTISYQSGWDRKYLYEEILHQSIEEDGRRGYTQFGPHKADFKILIRGIPAKDILSRGQQKMFVCAMILARGSLLQNGSLLHNRAHRHLVYLLDDLPAELDITSRSKLVALLSKQEAQIFMTAVESSSKDSLLTQVPLKMFHVEQGKLREVAN